MLTAVLTAHVDADLVATDQGCFTRIILISVDGREHVINILVSCSMLSRCTLKGKKARPHMNHNDMMHCGRVLIACFGTLPAEGWCGVVWCGVVVWRYEVCCGVVWCGVVCVRHRAININTWLESSRHSMDVQEAQLFIPAVACTAQCGAGICIACLQEPALCHRCLVSICRS